MEPDEAAQTPTPPAPAAAHAPMTPSLPQRRAAAVLEPQHAPGPPPDINPQAFEAAGAQVHARPSWSPVHATAEADPSDEPLAAPEPVVHHRPHHEFVAHTMTPRALTTAGYVIGGVINGIAAWYWYRTNERGRFDITGSQWRQILSISVLGGALVVLGMVWWTTAAALNVRQRTPMGVSPWLAPFVYIGGPLLYGVGTMIPEPTKFVFLAVTVPLLCFGHLFVLLSVRATARRIGAPTRSWSQMIWLPFLIVGLRMLVVLITSHGSTTGTPAIVGSFALDCVLLLVYASAAWAGMGSFDHSSLRKVSKEVDPLSLLRRSHPAE